MPTYNFYLKYNTTSQSVADFTTGSDHLLYDEAWHQFWPGLSRDSAIEYDIWEKKYRRKFKGDLVFFNNSHQTDFTYLYQVAKESVEISIRIEQTCVTTASDWWEGYFSIVDGKWDSDRGTLTVTPSPDDEYRLLEELGDREYNLYGLNPSDALSINVTSTTVTIESDCTALDKLEWQRDYDTEGNPCAPDADSDRWSLYSWTGSVTCGTGVNVHTYKKQIITFDGGIAWTNEGTAQYHYNNGIWSKPGGTPQVVTQAFGNSRWLTVKSGIEYILDQIYTTPPTYKSTFFENDTVVGGGSGGTENYVTSVDPNPLNNLRFTQKSNTKSTTNAATKWITSFNDFMQVLKDMFNVYWFIDTDGNFRIEHYSYWDTSPTSDTDLTTLNSGKWINAKNKWEYESVDMPNIEHFTWAESYRTDFIGYDIIYDNVETGNRYKDNKRERILPVTTEVAYLISNPDDISNEGWCFVVNAGGYISSEVGVLTSIEQINGHLSWANLHNNYWKHGRVIQNGSMNNVSTTFLSWERRIKQTEITYPECCDTFDPMATKTTELGDGEVQSAEYRLIDGSVKTVFFFS